MGRLRHLLAANAHRRAADAADPTQGARLARLRAWQADRLAATYADLAATPRYAAAVAFFLGELYGGAELEPRDRDLERAAGALERMLPRAALAALEEAIALELASQELDARLARRLPAGASLTGKAYAAAYRESASRTERETQLEAILELGRALDRLVRRPALGLLLRVARAPAEAAGLGALQGFLERGYAAFRAARGAGEFLATVRARESQLLDRLYRGDATLPGARTA
jgi:hypothetical protein